jgi:hypothetical protein
LDAKDMSGDVSTEEMNAMLRSGYNLPGRTVEGALDAASSRVANREKRSLFNGIV